MNDIAPIATLLEFRLNGQTVAVSSPPLTRLSDVLRDELKLTGTKVGCNAGDCGACTVLIDGRQRCACLTAVAQVAGSTVTTVEGLACDARLAPVQQSFHRHMGAQCGICTPGMLMAASDLLSREPRPTDEQILDALGGVLCRCTGYQKIIEAVRDAASAIALPEPPAAGFAMGARALKVDGIAKLTGAERFGADVIPQNASWLRVIRSPHASATFSIGDLSMWVNGTAGISRVLTAADVPRNGFGIYPHIKDQPVLAAERVRYRGEAVMAIIGTKSAIEAIDETALPIRYELTSPLSGIDAAMDNNAPLIQIDKPGNVLIDGHVRRGDLDDAWPHCAAVAEGLFETAFVEHAYIEPEAGYARRVGDRVEIYVSTQTPYMDRDEIALIMALKTEQVRIVPTACGGGFGGKLDLSVQPLIALAAWLMNRPVACVYTRPESMTATTKRHPARIKVKFGADHEGRLQAAHIDALFNTGPYASWGPTVANRVPIHATGPYFVPHVVARGRAIFTNDPIAGAFRGFGVPQAAIAHEAMLDDLAERLQLDRLDIRQRNALRVGDTTATGQKLEASCGLIQCLEALVPHWQEALAQTEAFNRDHDVVKRGVGIACMWYGIGNTALSNPSTLRVGINAEGAVTFYNGAADIGQGTNTTLLQVCADALGIPMAQFRYVMGDTDLTPDAGKSSASRQAFVSGKAAERAGREMRRQILERCGAAEPAYISIDHGRIRVANGMGEFDIDLHALETLPNGDVLVAEGRFDPPTVPLDSEGQGSPYATYAFAAQIAIVEVDTELGTTQVKKMIAAHDVGRAINPQQVEGQIHGGIAQGLGLALMEEYIAAKTENLHDYLIPTIGDVPHIDTILIEDREPLGPGGAKGVGEPALVPTAAAILGAIRHATGVRLYSVPVLPHRLREALQRQAASRQP